MRSLVLCLLLLSACRSSPRPDLTGPDLHGQDLRGRDFVGADLAWANLDGANLSGADLSGANLRGASLRDAVLDGAWLVGAVLDDAELVGTQLRGVHAPWASLRRAWIGAGATTLSYSDLRGADLRCATIIADAHFTDFRFARLGGAELDPQSDFAGAMFLGADLSLSPEQCECFAPFPVDALTALGPWPMLCPDGHRTSGRRDPWPPEGESEDLSDVFCEGHLRAPR